MAVSFGKVVKGIVKSALGIAALAAVPALIVGGLVLDVLGAFGGMGNLGATQAGGQLALACLDLIRMADLFRYDPSEKYQASAPPVDRRPPPSYMPPPPPPQKAAPIPQAPPIAPPRNVTPPPIPKTAAVTPPPPPPQKAEPIRQAPPIVPKVVTPPPKRTTPPPLPTAQAFTAVIPPVAPPVKMVAVPKVNFEAEITRKPAQTTANMQRSPSLIEVGNLGKIAQAITSNWSMDKAPQQDLQNRPPTYVVIKNNANASDNIRVYHDKMVGSGKSVEGCMTMLKAMEATLDKNATLKITVKSDAAMENMKAAYKELHGKEPAPGMIEKAGAVKTEKAAQAIESKKQQAQEQKQDNTSSGPALGRSRSE